MLVDEHQTLTSRTTRRGVLTLVAGLLILTWLILTPSGILGKADAVAYAVCHRIDLRSFHIGDRQFPFCVRCTGQFLGTLLAIIYQSLISKRCMGKPRRAVTVVLVVLFLAYVVDGLNSYLHLTPMMVVLPNLPRFYEPSNILRLLTGTGIGVVIGAYLYPSFNSIAWREPDPKPALPNLLSVGGLILLELVLVWIVWLQQTWLLYILAILSALATLTTLGMVYTIVILMIMRQENRFKRMRQLVFPLMAGSTIALLQIAIIDLLRFLLTGTWNGFYLG